jgi:putative peptidoglycan lipid II flippase
LTDRVGRTAVGLAPLAMLARGVAFLVPVVIAAVHGATPETDAFFYALAVPSFTMVITVNAIIAIVGPAAARARDVEGFGGTALVGSAAISAAIATSLALGLTPLMRATGDFEPETRTLAQHAAWTLIPFAALLGATGVLRTLIELRGLFASSALGPLVRGGTVLVAVISLRRLGPASLPTAFILGQSAEFLWQWAGLRRAGGRLRPQVFPLHPEVRATLGGLGWLVAGEALIATNGVIDRAFAARLPGGAVSHLEYADRTRTIPQTFLESTLLPVASATWSNHLARGDHAAYRRDLERTLSWVAGLSPPVLASLFLAREAAIRTLYLRGAFTDADAAVVSSAFGIYVLGLWGMLLGTVSVRALATEGRTPWVTSIGAISLGVNATLDLLLYRPYGVSGLAVSSAVTWTITGLTATALVGRRLGTSASGRRWAAAAGSWAVAWSYATAVHLAGLTPQSVSDPRIALAGAPILLTVFGMWLDRKES